MEYRRANRAEWPALAQLWQQAFGDPPEFAHKVFSDFAGPDGVWTAVEKDEPVSLLCAVPVNLGERQGAYFYGLATRMDWRGKGLMHQMIQRVCAQLEQQGCSFVCLIPAGPSLFDFYAQQGFQKAFGKRVVTLPVRRNLWAHAEFDSVTARTLTELRRTYAPNAVQLDVQRTGVVLGDLYSGGVTIVSTDQGYGLYFVKGEELRFTELFAASDRAAEDLLEAAREKERAETARLVLGDAQELFMGAGEAQDYGMIRFLHQPFDVSESYMRLMLDELYD